MRADWIRERTGVHTRHVATPVSQRKPYPSDLSGARWALIEPTLTAWRTARIDRRPTGQPPKVELHDVFDAILYVNRP